VRMVLQVITSLRESVCRKVFNVTGLTKAKFLKGRKMRKFILTGLFLCVVCGGYAFAEEAGGEVAASPIDLLRSEMQNNINIVWTCIAAFMVFFIQAGFAMVEAGFTRAKNAVNILMKNLMDFSIGTIAFFVIGFTLMFGASIKGFIGWDGFGVSELSKSGSDWSWTFLIFQTVFAGTAATIVSGAMAGRTKF
jgi:Amt family ammonium transporter